MALAEARSQRVDIPIIGGAYESSSLPISAQEAVNCFVEAGQESTNPVSLRGAPGASRFTDLEDIRGIHSAFGKMYVVADTHVYSIASTGSLTLLGDVLNDGKPAHLTHNIFELVITSAGCWYTIQKRSESIAKIETVPASHASFLDGYVLAIEKNSGRYIFSDINDADSVSGLDFGTAEGLPDNNIGMIVDHREVILFGEKSIERLYDDGVSPFIRLPNGFIERGCGAGDSPAKLDNTVFWLGDDYIVYRLAEGRPSRVSNHGIEQLIQRTENRSDAVGMVYSKDGHSFYQLNFPGQLTIVYDASTGAWHTGKMFGRKDSGYSHYCYEYGRHFVGGQNLYELDGSLEFNGPLERIRTFGPIRTKRRYSSMYSMGLLFETGSSASNVDPKTIFLEISDDGGRSFSNRRQASLGSRGGYTQEVLFHGLGGLYDNQRVMRLTLTDAAEFNLVEAYADIG